MSLHEFPDLGQGSDAWLAQRRGMVTASVVGQLVTVGPPDALDVDCPACRAVRQRDCLSVVRKVPTPLKTCHKERLAKAAGYPPVIGVAKNDTSRGLTATLVAERITGHTDPTYISDDMWRGIEDEPRARDKYAETYAPVEQVGFMVREWDGCQLGYSPDGLVGDDGLLEIKSRRQKKQLATILADQVPPENVAQCQAGLFVSGRDWLDYISYCGGMPMYVKRVTPDPRWFKAIVAAVEQFEKEAVAITAAYRKATDGLVMTERAVEMEMI